MAREVLLLGLLLAVLFVLGRVVLGAPWIGRVRDTLSEAFTGGPHLLNTITECPPGSTLYMYGGTAYCCSGTVNVDADTVGESCRILWTRPRPGAGSPPVFCTLGPSQNGIKNCLETRAGLLQAEGESVCPSKAGTFVMDASGNATCCAGAGNAALTACQNPTGSCSVTRDANIFKPVGGPTGPTGPSCQLLRAQEDDGPCPSGFAPFLRPGDANGPLASLLVYGCERGDDSHRTYCYEAGMVARLKELGLDVRGLTVCTQSHGGPS